MGKLDDLKWYVIMDDFNNKTFKKVNILEHGGLTRDLEEHLKKYTTFDDFKEKLKSELSYYYQSRAEYEVIIYDLCEKISRKFSIYDRVIDNLDLMANYIIDEYNKKSRKKLEK